jgi:hypothetical protein
LSGALPDECLKHLGLDKALSPDTQNLVERLFGGASPLVSPRGPDAPVVPAFLIQPGCPQSDIMNLARTMRANGASNEAARLLAAGAACPNYDHVERAELVTWITAAKHSPDDSVVKASRNQLLGALITQACDPDRMLLDASVTSRKLGKLPEEAVPARDVESARLLIVQLTALASQDPSSPVNDILPNVILQCAKRGEPDLQWLLEQGVDIGIQGKMDVIALMLAQAQDGKESAVFALLQVAT